MKAKKSKYFFEIAVIFIGITMSFLFEEWRQSRENNSKEREYLLLLHEDVKILQTEIEDMDSLTQLGIKAGEYVLANKQKDSLLFYMASPYYWKNKEIKFPTYETLVATGDVGIIRDKTIPILIFKIDQFFQSTLKPLLDEEDRVYATRFRKIQDKYPFVVDLYKFNFENTKGSPAPAYLEKMRKEPEYVDVLYEYKFLGRYIRQHLVQLQLMLKELDICIEQGLE